MFFRLKFGFTLLAVLVFGNSVSSARAEDGQPPDIVIFCEPTLRHAIDHVGAIWRAKTGIPVHIFSTPTAAALEQISHAPRSDLIVGEGEALLAAGTTRHLIKGEPVHEPWRNRLVIAQIGASAGTTQLSAQTDLLAMAGSRPIAVIDPIIGPIGADTRQAFQSLGLWEPVAGHSVGVVGTEDAVYLLTDDTVKLAVVYATDVASHPKLSIAATVPDDAYPPVTYWVAETSTLQSEGAVKFMAFLSEPDTRKLLRADGLEIAP